MSAASRFAVHQYAPSLVAALGNGGAWITWHAGGHKAPELTPLVCAVLREALEAETDADRGVVRMFGATLERAYQAPEPLTRDGALAIVRALLDDDRLDSRETEALEVLLHGEDRADGGGTVADLVERARAAMRRLCRSSATMADGGEAEEALGDLARVALRNCDAPSRTVLPQGTSQAIGEAVGAAARELLAEHGAPAGVVLEVRLVRRGADHGTTLLCGHWRGDLMCTLNAGHTGPHCPDCRGRSCERHDAADQIREAQARVDTLCEKYSSYDGGDRPMSPPVSLIRELNEAEAELRRLRGDA